MSRRSRSRSSRSSWAYRSHRRLGPGYGIESAKLVGTQVDVILDQLSCDEMAVVTTRRAGREGCEGSDPTEIDLLKLP